MIAHNHGCLFICRAARSSAAQMLLAWAFLFQSNAEGSFMLERCCQMADAFVAHLQARGASKQPMRQPSTWQP